MSNISEPIHWTGGWVCSSCGQSYGPFVAQCSNCRPKIESGNMTIYIPDLKEEWQTGGKYEPTLGSVVIQLTRMEALLIEEVRKNNKLEIIQRMIEGRTMYDDPAVQAAADDILLDMILEEIGDDDHNLPTPES